MAKEKTKNKKPARATVRRMRKLARWFDEYYSIAVALFSRWISAHNVQDDLAIEAWIKFCKKGDPKRTGGKSFFTRGCRWMFNDYLREYYARMATQGQYVANPPARAGQTDWLASEDSSIRKRLQIPDESELQLLCFMTACNLKAPPHKILAFFLEAVLKQKPAKKQPDFLEMPLRNLAAKIQRMFAKLSGLPDREIEHGFKRLMSRIPSAAPSLRAHIDALPKPDRRLSDWKYEVRNRIHDEVLKKLINRRVKQIGKPSKE